MTCPECGAGCEAQFVDLGVGEQQVGPYHCFECNWTEEAPMDLDDP